MRPDVGEEVPAVTLGEGLSRQRRAGAGTTWAWGSLVWVRVGVHLRQDTRFESSGRPLKQATEHRDTQFPSFGPCYLWGSVQADTWQRAPGG